MQFCRSLRSKLAISKITSGDMLDLVDESCRATCFATEEFQTLPRTSSENGLAAKPLGSKRRGLDGRGWNPVARISPGWT